MNQKIISVITGATGFVGSHLADLLIAKGHHVKCITRKTSNLQWLSDKPVEIIDCGLNNVESLKEVLKDADYLYHVAGVVKSKTPEGYYKGNVETTSNLLDALVHLNSKIKRVLIVSSQTAAGPSLPGKAVNEEDDPHPITTYGKSKLEQELTARAYMDRLPITIVRAPAVYGERDTEIFLVFKTYKQGLFTLVGFDKKQVSLIHAADLVRGMQLAAESEKAAGETYFISSEEYYTWDVVGNAMADAFGKKAIKLKIPHFLVYTTAGIAEFFAMFSKKAATFNIEKARDFVQSYWTADVSKAKRDLGFRQEISISEGVKRTVEWYKEMKWF